MEQDKKALLIKYIVCFCAAVLITVCTFWVEGFFTSDAGRNIQILADGFTVSGGLMLMFAGMLFISGEGGLIGISYVLRYVVLTFVPMGRNKQELYRDYRERKRKEIKKSGDHALLIVGAAFFLIGMIFTVIWYSNFYHTTA